MTGIFVTVLNMSIAASIAIVMVIFLRLLLKKMPAIFSYCLWLAVFVRLFIPFSLEADWGIIPSTHLSGTGADGFGAAAAYGGGALPQGEDFSGKGNISDAGAALGNENMTVGIAVTENRGMSGNIVSPGNGGSFGLSVFGGEEKSLFLPDIKSLTAGLALLWITGFALLLFYGIFSYICFMKILAGGEKDKNGQGEQDRKYIADGKYRIAVSENIRAPFVAGFLKPVIYLPRGLDKVQSDMVCAHEKVHIARRDYLIKPVACLAVCIHWFNPFVWLAFRLMEEDMEASCDEAVLARLGNDDNKVYARTLLAISREYSWKSGCPIAFGENSVKSRIKNAVRYKKAKPLAAVLGGTVILAAAALIFVNSRWKLVISLTDRETAQDMPQMEAITQKQGVPGTDSNTEANYIYGGENPGEQEAGEEAVYLPEEKIVHTKPISSEEDDASVTEHHFYMEEDAYRENQPEGNGDAQDDYGVLLRSSEGVHEMVTLKYAYPLTFERISDDYGTRIHPMTGKKLIHSGMDFAAERGTPVKAAAAGYVYETGTDAACGNYVIIQHSNGDMTYYANCAEILVETGAEVKQGEQIATVGSTGRSTGPHLHYALSRNGEFVKPEFS